MTEKNDINDVFKAIADMKAKQEEMYGPEVECRVDCPIHGLQITTYRPKKGEQPINYCKKCRKEEEARKATIHDIKVGFRDAQREFLTYLGPTVNFLDPDKTFATYRLETAEQRHNAEVARRFSERLIDRILSGNKKHAGQGLILYGKWGRGKTHLACALGNRLAELSMFPVYLRASTFMAAIKDSKKSLSTVLALASRVSCFILDELGRSPCTVYEQNALLELMDSRFMLGRPTVFITNLDPKTIPASLGEAFLSRTFEQLYPLTFTGRDYRVHELEEF